MSDCCVYYVQVTSKLIRATIHIGLVCQTIAVRPVERGKESELTRDDIQCRLSYAANGTFIISQSPALLFKVDVT